MSIETRFIEPLDVLFLRGNKLFGDAGSHGVAGAVKRDGLPV